MNVQVAGLLGRLAALASLVQPSLSSHRPHFTRTRQCEFEGFSWSVKNKKLEELHRVHPVSHHFYHGFYLTV